MRRAPCCRLRLRAQPGHVQIVVVAQGDIDHHAVNGFVQDGGIKGVGGHVEPEAPHVHPRFGVRHLPAEICLARGDFAAGAADAKRTLERARHFKVQHGGEVFGYGHVEPQTQTLVCLEPTALNLPVQRIDNVHVIEIGHGPQVSAVNPDVHGGRGGWEKQREGGRKR